MYAIGLSFVLTSLEKIRNPKWQTVQQNEFKIQLDDKPSMNIKDTRFKFFHVFRKTSSGIGTLPPDKSKDIDRYINIQYYQYQEDWWSVDSDKVWIEFGSNVKRCNKDDFGGDEEGNKLYDTWHTSSYNFDLFCPDLEVTNLEL